jgi:hypothetical protein
MTTRGRQFTSRQTGPLEGLPGKTVFSKACLGLHAKDNVFSGNGSWLSIWEIFPYPKQKTQ